MSDDRESLEGNDNEPDFEPAQYDDAEVYPWDCDNSSGW
jgi:hypothetical protein